jgi:AcrR family transcriptional regulator
MEMPKEYFYNLKPTKVENVLEGAIEEFSQYLLEDASINRIITRIGISRGSFYNYFIDLDDLYRYVVKQTQMDFFQRLITMIHESYGNIGLAFKKSMADLVNFIDNGEHSLVKNMILNIEMSSFLSKDHSIAATVGEEELSRFNRSIDRSRYKLDDQEFSDYIEMLFILMYNHLFTYLKNEKPYSELYADFERKVDFLDAYALK